ncbi:RsmB/NOP family class I SAM-dependent RNA methyltransferase [Paenibacillus protaetiae]|uniref:rRNA cytosine-C5-methyltransferase n=1 Tax=Paenibacillus protaetiae TaxID=2509456 RepID=A0A4V0YF41_9BACL|nr:RsmB/NOP family class I SAM-dependent RNA methyltransferase [Paenibacillus protaetiae]QAY66391.1 rRNA cytosine-C5-methyltransferase [Paenibacillus protaetiae]
MTVSLPLLFVERMKQLLKGDFDRFIASYDEPRLYGLRVNPLKITAGQWKELSPIGHSTKSVPWAPEGFYYNGEDRPARHPHYHAGLYYIQEPSAMAPVELLDVQPGHRVLDLCAAPGGKSTQIAGKLQGKGVLVTNDNARERTKPLAKNIELAGVRNAVVLNEEPASLVTVFRGWFDRILVDAPCSGEGMFRKDEAMVQSWESHSVERCSVMQHHILRHAAELLAPGGKLVYSTCTFAPEENERQIAKFLADRPDFEVVPVDPNYGWTEGRPDWADETEPGYEAGEWQRNVAETQGTVRLWPYLIHGEGHYAAVLRKKPGEAAPENRDAVAETAQAAWDIRGHIITENPDHRDARFEPAPDQRGGKKRRDDRGGRLNASVPRGGAKGKGAFKRLSTKEEGAAPEQLWERFASEQLLFQRQQEMQIYLFGSLVYLQPLGMPSLDGLKVVRSGWLIGGVDNGKFTPSQALAMGLTQREASVSLNWPAEDPQVFRYLRGETLFVEPDELITADSSVQKDKFKGYVLICADGYPLGWGVYAAGMVKNKLPAGWRRM